MEYRGHFSIGQKENFHYNYSVTQKRSIFACVLVFVIILLLNGFMRFSAGRAENFGGGLLQALPMAAVGGVALYLFNVLMIYVRIRTMYKKNLMQPFHQDVLIDGVGLHATSERGTMDLPWANIGTVQELGNLFLFFVSNTNAYVIPKKQMKDPAAETATIRAILREHMDASKLKLLG